jgi:hypothetical protein
VDRQVHLRVLDPAHLPDRALELTLQRAAIVDALREVGHRIRGLVEQLQPRASRVEPATLATATRARAGR